MGPPNGGLKVGFVLLICNHESLEKFVRRSSFFVQRRTSKCQSWRTFDLLFQPTEILWFGEKILTGCIWFNSECWSLVAGRKVPAERTGKMIQRRLKGIFWTLREKTCGKDMLWWLRFLGQILQTSWPVDVLLDLLQSDILFSAE